MLDSSTCNYLCANKLALTHLKIRLPTDYSLTNNTYV